MSTRPVHGLPMRPDAATQAGSRAPPPANIQGLAAAGACLTCNGKNCNYQHEVRVSTLAMKAPKKSMGARKKAKAAMLRAQQAAAAANMTVIQAGAAPAPAGDNMDVDPPLGSDAAPDDSNSPGNPDGGPPRKKRKIPKEFWPRKPPIFPPKETFSGTNPFNVPVEIFGEICSYLPIPSLVNLALVCRSHFEFLNDPSTHAKIWIPARAQYFNMPAPSSLIEDGVHSKTELAWALMWLAGGKCEFCGRWSYTSPIAFGTSRVIRVCLIQECRSFWRNQLRKQSNKKDIPALPISSTTTPHVAVGQNATDDDDDDEPPSGIDMIPSSAQGPTGAALGLPRYDLAPWIRQTRNVYEYVLNNDSLLNALRMREVDEQVPWLHYAMRMANDSENGHTGPLGAKKPTKKTFHAVDNYMNSRRRKAKRISPYPEFLCGSDQVLWPCEQLEKLAKAGLPFVEFGAGVNQNGSIVAGAANTRAYENKRKFRISDVLEAIDEWNESAFNGKRGELIEKWKVKVQHCEAKAVKCRELALWRNRFKKRSDDVRHRNDRYLRTRVENVLEKELPERRAALATKITEAQTKVNLENERLLACRSDPRIPIQQARVAAAQAAVAALGPQPENVEPTDAQKAANEELQKENMALGRLQAPATSCELRIVALQRELGLLLTEQADMPPHVPDKKLHWQDGSNAPTLVHQRIVAQIDQICLDENDHIWQSVRVKVVDECTLLQSRRTNREKEAHIRDSQSVIHAFHRNCNRDEEKARYGVQVVPPFGVFKMLETPKKLPKTLAELKNWDVHKPHMGDDLRAWQEQFRDMLKVTLSSESHPDGVSPDDACALFRCDACDQKTSKRRNETNTQIMKDRSEAQSKRQIHYNPMPNYKEPMTWTELVYHQCTERWDVANFSVDKPAAALTRKACRVVNLDAKTSPDVLDKMGKAWKCTHDECNLWLNYGELYDHCLRHAWAKANKRMNSRVELKDLFPKGISNVDDYEELDEHHFGMDIVASGFKKPETIRSAALPNFSRIPDPNEYASAPKNFVAKMTKASAQARNDTLVICCRCCVTAAEHLKYHGWSKPADPPKLKHLSFDGFRDHLLQKHKFSEVHTEDFLLIRNGLETTKAASKKTK